MITVLTHEKALATKVFSLGDDGKRRVKDYGKGAWFRATTLPCANVRELYSNLLALETAPRSFVIRGELLPERDPNNVRRAIRANPKGPAGFRECPRSWALIDCDTTLTEDEGKAYDVSSREQCEAGVRALLAKLPECLRDVTCVAQMSASAGIKPGFHAHLWFWLDRPMGETQLTNWADMLTEQAGHQVIDPTVFRTVQALYIARPVFGVGLSDPCPDRVFLVEGATDTASLPAVAGSRPGDSWRAILGRLRAAGNEKIHDHARNAAFAYFRQIGKAADPAVLFREMRAAVDFALEALGREGEAGYSDDELQRLVDSGRDVAARTVDVESRLVMTDNGRPVYGFPNAVNMLEAEGWAEKVWVNERDGRPRIGTRLLKDDDGAQAALGLAAHALQFVCSPELALAGLTHLANRRPREPWREYLESVVHDGTTRTESWLCDAFGAEDTPYARSVARKFLISVVARTFEPGCQVDTVLVLEGVGGLKKTSALIELVGVENYGADLPDIRSKDAKTYMAGPVIVEAKELAPFKYATPEQLRGFVDQRSDRFRPPYGRLEIDVPRRGVIVGTTNYREYLPDNEGTRRWWGIYCRRQMPTGFIASIRDQLWAEAAILYRAGVKWWVEANDPAFVIEQEARRIVDPLEGLIDDAVAKGACGLGIGLVSPAIPAGATELRVQQILEHVLGLPPERQGKGEQMRVARALKAAGWEKAISGLDRARIWVKIPQ